MKCLQAGRLSACVAINIGLGNPVLARTRLGVEEIDESWLVFGEFGELVRYFLFRKVGFCVCVVTGGIRVVACWMCGLGVWVC